MPLLIAVPTFAVPDNQGGEDITAISTFMTA
jgi:hypothetical protein